MSPALMVDALDSFGAAWSAGLLRAALQGGAAILLVWAALRMLPRVPPRIRCWFWRLAYLKLLIALLWATPIDVPLLPPRAPAPAIESVVSIAPNQTEPAGGVGVVLSPASAMPPAPGRPPIRWPSPVAALVLVWMAGALVCASRLAGQCREAARLRRGSLPLFDTGLRARWEQLSARFGLSRPPALHLAEGTVSPLLLNGVRPVVILPSALIAPERREDLDLMLAHELAHVVRRDLWWDWLPALSHCLFYFHPLIWLANREWRLSQETAADELAILGTGAAPYDYAEMLVNLAGRRPCRAEPGLATVGADDSPDVLRRRLIAMRYIRPLSFGRFLIAGGLAACLGAAIVIPFRLTARAAAPPPGIEGAYAADDGAAPSLTPETAPDAGFIDGREADAADPGRVSVRAVPLSTAADPPPAAPVSPVDPAAEPPGETPPGTPGAVPAPPPAEATDAAAPPDPPRPPAAPDAVPSPPQPPADPAIAGSRRLTSSERRKLAEERRRLEEERRGLEQARRELIRAREQVERALGNLELRGRRSEAMLDAIARREREAPGELPDAAHLREYGREMRERARDLSRRMREDRELPRGADRSEREGLTREHQRAIEEALSRVPAMVDREIARAKGEAARALRGHDLSQPGVREQIESALRQLPSAVEMGLGAARRQLREKHSELTPEQRGKLEATLKQVEERLRRLPAELKQLLEESKAERQLPAK